MKAPLLAAAALACSACAATRFQLPMTSAQLAAHGSAAALVAYLGQPDASPGVCEAGSNGAGLANAPDLGPAMIAALRGGRVAPPVWGECVEALLPRLDGAKAADLLARTVRAEAELLDDAGLEEDPQVQAQLAVLHRLYLERPPAVAPPERILDRAIAELAPKLPEPRNLAQSHLGPLARRSMAGRSSEAMARS
jgi:hypothetical protein